MDGPASFSDSKAVAVGGRHPGSTQAYRWARQPVKMMVRTPANPYCRERHGVKQEKTAGK